MAFEQYGADDVLALPPAADLTAKATHIATINSSGQAALAVAQTGHGVILEATEEAATVQHSGIAKVVCGDVFDAGVWVNSDANGKAVAASAGQAVLGIALEAGAANRVVSVLLKVRGRLA